MQLMDRITVETDLFEHREVKPHFINPCCFGEDFAVWIKRELSRFSALQFDLSEPVQEDYGWGSLGFARERSLLDRYFLRWGWATGSACSVDHLCHF